eukprot:SAG22_NODE_2288_length_2755_cov_20.440512_2_plen_103_part_00
MSLNGGCEGAGSGWQEYEGPIRLDGLSRDDRVCYYEADAETPCQPGPVVLRFRSDIDEGTSCWLFHDTGTQSALCLFISLYSGHGGPFQVWAMKDGALPTSG